MKPQYLIPIIAILLVVSVSGCIEGMDFLGFESLFGGQQTIEQTADIIITKDMYVMPPSPITADNEFTVLFTLKNQDQGQSINNVGIKLYNWGICEPMIDYFLPVGSEDDEQWDKPNGYYIRRFDEIVPLSEEAIEFRFQAPDNNKIGNIQATCPIKWEVRD